MSGKFVYGWDGISLVLIPENAPEFAEMQSFTELQSMSVHVSDLVVGGIYLDKYNREFTYLGKHPSYDEYGQKHGNEHYTFQGYLTASKKVQANKYVGMNSDYEGLLKKIDVLIADAVSKNFKVKKITDYTEAERTELIFKKNVKW